MRSDSTSKRTRDAGVALERLAPLLLAIVVGFASWGSRGIYESTEGRYAEHAGEMLVSGDYLTPTLDWQPHFTKPPLTYWVIAAGVRWLGRNAWAEAERVVQ